MFGSADYSSLLPPNSYIDVFNFTSVHQLINYLNHVSSDPEIYGSYFQWKKDFCVQRMEDKKFCQLCQHLNYNGRNLRWTWSRRSGEDLAKWWVESAQCKTVQINWWPIEKQSSGWLTASALIFILVLIDSIFDVNNCWTRINRFTRMTCDDLKSWQARSKRHCHIRNLAPASIKKFLSI